MIITFEGGEGTGKTTGCARLCSYLDSKGLPWLSIREPGGSSLSEAIRSLFLNRDMDVMTELLLVLASRRQNIVEVIEPCIAAGKIVVMDRFVDSTLVYQGIVGGIGLEKVRSIMEATGTWMTPDLTFVMDASPELALARIQASDRFERSDARYHLSLREAFLKVACEQRHRVIDSARDRETVHRAIIQEVEPVLGKTS